MSTLRTVRSASYFSARRIGDVHAAMRGPVPLTKRVVRKRVLRVTNKGVMRSMRKLGLFWSLRGRRAVVRLPAPPRGFDPRPRRNALRPSRSGVLF